MRDATCGGASARTLAYDINNRIEIRPARKQTGGIYWWPLKKSDRLVSVQTLCVKETLDEAQVLAQALKMGKQHGGTSLA